MGSKIVLPFKKELVLTEYEAINISREALMRYGVDVGSLRPMPFTNDPNQGDRFFARNNVNPNSGYILWERQHSEGQNQTGYSVRIDPQFVCSVGPTK